MSKSKLTGPPDLKYSRVEVAGLPKGRRGKHHELMQEIFREIDVLSAGSAMEIPLSDVGDVGITNFRSAVHRAANTRGLKIKTLADEKNFYVWKPMSKEIPALRFSAAVEVHHD
jgi:hypothetical protein